MAQALSALDQVRGETLELIVPTASPPAPLAGLPCHRPHRAPTTPRRRQPARPAGAANFPRRQPRLRAPATPAARRTCGPRPSPACGRDLPGGAWLNRRLNPPPGLRGGRGTARRRPAAVTYLQSTARILYLPGSIGPFVVCEMRSPGHLKRKRRCSGTYHAGLVEPAAGDMAPRAENVGHKVERDLQGQSIQEIRTGLC